VRFAVSGGLFPHHVDEFTEEMAAQVRALGFTGIFTRFDRDDPFATTAAQCQRVRAILADYGLTMVQAIGHRPPLIHPDEAVRRQAAKTLREAIRIAAALGSLSCHSGPGSLAQHSLQPAGAGGGSAWGGAWDPHPDNWEPICRDHVIQSLKEVAPAAEDAGVVVGLEGHVLVTLNSAERMREVLDAVDSPAIRCDLDPVNWLTLETVYRNGPAIDRMVDLLGPRIFNAHAKDVVVQNRLVIHIDECPAGQGLLDYPRFMRRMEALGPERFLVVEHAAVEELPAVKAFLDRQAAELGIRVW
jgi:sugar phosphate isomerase/epimerase